MKFFVIWSKNAHLAPRNQGVEACDSLKRALERVSLMEEEGYECQIFKGDMIYP